MALATVEDVLRMLRIPESSVNEERDDQIAAALETAQEWVSARLRQRYDVEEGGLLVVHDVRETDSVLLPRVGAIVNEVRVTLNVSTEFAESDERILEFDAYDVIDGPRGATAIQLRPQLLFAPFEGAIAQRFPRTYRKVEIAWDVPDDEFNTVPAPVRDATALIAAGLWTSSPRLASGYSSEKIGDYQYTLGTGSSSSGSSGSSPESPGNDYWSQAAKLLRPFIQRKPLAM